jgi:hypothetical protein
LPHFIGDVGGLIGIGFGLDAAIIAKLDQAMRRKIIRRDDSAAPIATKHAHRAAAWQAIGARFRAGWIDAAIGELRHDIRNVRIDRMRLRRLRGGVGPGR